ncbi:uncharacterized protein LOC113515514 isoform X2 [Galleria mellonella]|uniref:Uncharacterized protein LOC113515514 isoform X2 n=1 Tax=Galleria mellonella TaxID=7137 RepID=A0A6J3BYT1_GALME|nr:uncharacterized protein LOC113515514 isoform X2 [Galleria mellonella]
MTKSANLLEVISMCLLPKLSKNVDISENHVEYKIREDTLTSQFNVIMQLLNDMNNSEMTPDILSRLLILNLELQSVGPWFSEICKKCTEKLNKDFEGSYGYKLDNLLWHGDAVNSQKIFDKCLEDLHQKLTFEDFKKYPALHDEYKVDINPLKTIPISLLLIDDYILSNKIKGLKSCLIIMKCLTTESFQDGNYYEVIYGTLKKSTLDKDIDVTRLTLECLLQLLKIIPPGVQAKKTDDIFKRGLDQLYTEANLYRKAALFSFTTNLIEMQGVDCVNKKLLKSILCDNIDICCNDAVGEILLSDVLKCLEVWIKYCWCIWRLPSDQKFLSTLLKLLYVSCQDEEKAARIQILIITLITLCTKEEQNALYKNIEESTVHINRPEFVNTLEVIKKKYSCIINLLKIS